MSTSGEPAFEPLGPPPAAARASRRAALASRPELAALAGQVRPAALAAEDVLAPDGELAGLLGAPGLRRGWTVVVDGAPGAGATSLLCRLLAAPTTSGAWGALVGFPALGLVAAEELGVALDRLVVVPEIPEHLAAVVATLLEGCDLVVVRPCGALSPRDATRLAARARERRSVLVVAGASVGDLAAGAPAGRLVRPWPGEPDVTLEAASGSWVGIGRGSGRLVAHGAEVLARQRRRAPGGRRHVLWLQDRPGEPEAVGLELAGSGSKAAPARRATG